MPYPYFGTVEEKRGEKGGAGIRVLAKFENGQLVPRFDPAAEVGPTEMVFLQDHKSPFALGSPVRFDIEPIPEQRGKDRDRVALRGNGWAISRAKQTFAVIDGRSCGPLIAGRRELRTAGEMTAGISDVYVLDRSSLVGPWHIKSETPEQAILEPLAGDRYRSKRVFRFPWPTVALYVAIASHQSRGPVLGFLLEELDPAEADPIDLATGDQMASWFLKQAGELPVLEKAFAALDVAVPGWRKTFRSSLADERDPIDRKIFLRRMGELEESIQAVHFGADQLRELVGTPAFADLRSQLEAAAREQVQLRIEKELNPRRKQAEADLAALAAKVAAEEKRLAGLHKECSREIDLCRQAASQLRDLEEHLSGERERLLRDAALLQPPNNPRRVSLLARRTQAPSEKPLEVNLSDWIGDGGNANALQHVLRSCRLAIVPNIGWTRAWVEATGAELHILQVEPHWLAFGDALEAGLAGALSRAGSGERVVLHIADFDRSPPELWLRPVLDLASGARDHLEPLVDAWPAEFRVVVSLGSTQPRHQTCGWVLDHFASPRQYGDDRDRHGGDVAPELLRFVERETGELATAIEAATNEPSSNEGAERARERADLLRRSWPQSYSRAPAVE